MSGRTWDHDTDLATAHEVICFLALRQAHLPGGGDLGRSSDVMIARALNVGRQSPPDPSNRPADLSDLGRCCDAFHHAPGSLKKRLLPLLAAEVNRLLDEQLRKSWAAADRPSVAPAGEPQIGVVT